MREKYLKCLESVQAFDVNFNNLPEDLSHLETAILDARAEYDVATSQRKSISSFSHQDTQTVAFASLIALKALDCLKDQRYSDCYDILEKFDELPFEEEKENEGYYGFMLKSPYRKLLISEAFLWKANREVREEEWDLAYQTTS